MKKLIFAIIAAILFLSSCGVASQTPTTPDTASVEGKTVNIEAGTELSASVWNEAEYYYNENEIKSAPVLYKGITIGSGLDEVLEAFGLCPGYATVNREIDTCGDGTTEIVEEEYSNTDFFESEKVLDASFDFAYIRDGEEWTLVKADKIEELYESGEDAIFYSVDFLGGVMEGEAAVGVKQVVSFTVTRGTAD